MPGISYSDLSALLIKLQSYPESSWGVPAAATTKWQALRQFPEFKPYRKSTVYQEVRGSLAPGFLSSILRNGGEYKIPGYLTFEDAIYLGSNFFGVVSPSGSPTYTWAFTGADTTQPALQSFAFEYNQTSGMVLARGCVANKLEIKGNASEAITYDLSGLCVDVDTGTGSPMTSLSDRTGLEVALMPSAGLYMDTGSPVGSTSFGQTLLTYDLSLENPIDYIYTAGQLTPAVPVAGKAFKSDLSVDLLYTAAVKTFVTSQLLAGSTALFRLKIMGSSSREIDLDFAGVLADDPALFGNKNGAQMAQLKLSGIKASAGWHTAMTVVNGIAALT